MNNTLFNYLMESSSVLTVQQIILNFIFVLLLSFCIYISYKFSYSRIAYSARFNASLMLLAIISTLIMSCIGNNVALSLGMVGALSIIRFRTSVKDSRDTAYIFWAIAVGICCGVSDYLVASIGTIFVFILLLIFGNVQSNTRYLLVIRAKHGASKEIRDAVDNYYGGRAIFRVDNSNPQMDEIIYLVSEGTIAKAEKTQSTSINDTLYGISQVESVNMVSQNNEMNA